jgi:hypothetical protein
MGDAMPIEAKHQSHLEAVRLLTEIIKDGNQAKLIAYAASDGQDNRWIKNLVKKISNNELIERINVANQEIIKDFYHYELGDYTFYAELLKRLGDPIRDQGKMNDFVGKYLAYYYEKDSEKGYRQGSVNIKKNENGSYSYQSIIKSDSGVVYRHDGFAFIVSKRIYFTGLGYNFTRPVLFNVMDKDVRNNPIDGIVLSITKADGNIFARRLFLVHESNHNQYTVITDNDIRKHFLATTKGEGVFEVE